MKKFSLRFRCEIVFIAAVLLAAGSMLSIPGGGPLQFSLADRISANRGGGKNRLPEIPVFSQKKDEKYFFQWKYRRFGDKFSMDQRGNK